MAAALGVQLPLMIAFPIALGLFIRRRFGEPISVWVVGACAFVASQIVHLPLNFALGLIGPPRGVALWPLPIVAAIVGLSAGLCEEPARYVALRYVLKQRRTWQTGVQLGAGHGGIEAIVIGGLALLGLVNVLVAPWAESLGASADDQAALRHGARMYWQMAAYMPILAGYERLCAIAFHIGASTLVLRGIVRRNIGYLLLAIGLHALLDAPTVYLQKIGLAPMYVFLTITAVVMLAICWRLRACEPTSS